ncbi:S8 family peptidase [Clostridium sp.]|uniref:S8 family peptidase n=1 Tax=Clostridium sp. TaxID=1506 RepID=UPI0025D5368A|nr:S8 family peptidase [uncultured Clostridium sp.]MDU4882473.1 S8 family peptidase [Clostridium celatum]MDU7075821.1 S8 family peptidase [Clostridium celatum]
MNNNANTEYVFNSPDYNHIMVQYSGNIPNIPKNDNGLYITKVNDNYAIISLKISITELVHEIISNNDIDNIREILEKNLDIGDFKIIYIIPTQLYTLQEISAIDAAQVSTVGINTALNLTGEGVIVGIIDTGIDYLSDEFRDESGKSRIISIWDQTIESNENDSKDVPFGTIYTNEEINRAIEAYESGGNPYDIVPSKDLNGHGTGMAGIVGATGKNKDIRGIAPKCNFVIVKLSEFNIVKKLLSTKTPIFGLTSIFPAIEYLRKILLSEKMPVVVLLPLGSNNGDHKGNTLFDGYIESVSSNVGIVIVTGAGNEGNRDEHVSGIIRNSNEIETINLFIEENQRYMGMEIWIDLPSIVDINLVSPSGEETGFIQAATNIQRDNKFIFEKTQAKISYFLPEEYAGDELISIYFSNIVSGIWQIKLKLRSGEMARYNAWIWQYGLSLPNTRFSPSDPYGTITIPGDSTLVVTVAAYNQNNNNLLTYSGLSFRQEYIKKIDFAAGGVNTMTVGLNNSTQIINGTSLSAAVGAGACILLFQWGIVEGNYPYMYSQSIKTFLTRGVIKRGKDVYPNPELGYGILNFYKIFENMH